MAPPVEPPDVPTNLRALLWSHVTITEKSPGGGNTIWSYSRFSAHLPKKTRSQGIHACKKLTVDILNALRRVSARLLKKTVFLTSILYFLNLKNCKTCPPLLALFQNGEFKYQYRPDTDTDTRIRIGAS